MTEKRFNVFDVDGTIFFEDHKEGSYHIGEIGNVDVNCLNDIADRLNELAEENKDKKAMIEFLSTENTQIMNELKTRTQIQHQLEEENEQLKQENYELHKRLGDFEQFEEHIKERTSKTSVNDIIGLVKTDEPTNSVELKKELYK